VVVRVGVEARLDQEEEIPAPLPPDLSPPRSRHFRLREEPVEGASTEELEAEGLDVERVERIPEPDPRLEVVVGPEREQRKREDQQRPGDARRRRASAHELCKQASAEHEREDGKIDDPEVLRAE